MQVWNSSGSVGQYLAARRRSHAVARAHDTEGSYREGAQDGPLNPNRSAIWGQLLHHAALPAISGTSLQACRFCDCIGLSCCFCLNDDPGHAHLVRSFRLRKILLPQASLRDVLENATIARSLQQHVPIREVGVDDVFSCLTKYRPGCCLSITAPRYISSSLHGRRALVVPSMSRRPRGV